MSILSELATETTQRHSLYPQESLQVLHKKSKQLVIGIPKEISLQEKRIALTPDAVGGLIKNGHQIKIERGAGAGANFSDLKYSEVGAEIVDSPLSAFDADIVLKIEPPVEQEFQYLKQQTTLFSAVNLPTLGKPYFQELSKKKITAIGFEYIEDKIGGLPILRAMSEIAGSTVMLIAAEYLSSSHGGRGMILGGITGVPPTKVVILGAGTVGEFAARTAIGLGADVKVFDKHIYKLQRIRQTVGHHIYTSIIDSDTLRKALSRADVVIGAIRPDEDFIVPETMIAEMKTGAVLIDVSIDQGRCFETSKTTNLENPVFTQHGVIHYCVPNLPSRVARTASMALSNTFLPFLLKIGSFGGVEEMIFSNRWFMKGAYCYKGNCTNQQIAERFDLRYRDLSLLLAARM